MRQFKQQFLAGVEGERNAFALGYNYRSDVVPSPSLMLVGPVISVYASTYMR
jgi:hypothetical protein